MQFFIHMYNSNVNNEYKWLCKCKDINTPKKDKMVIIFYKHYLESLSRKGT